jgi:hypothetical protein
MAKQTTRWGSPVFTDTSTKQSVTTDIIHKQLTGIVMGVLGDIEQKVWLSLRYKMLGLFAELYYVHMCGTHYLTYRKKTTLLESNHILISNNLTTCSIPLVWDYKVLA